MTSLSERWGRWRRRRFGRYTIEDPRPLAERAPYTFFLPSENELLALQPGDLAKLVFVGNPGGATFDTERMWVSITATDGDALVGRLDNVPSELHQLRVHDIIRFRRHQVIDLIWSEERRQVPPSAPPHRQYWERCLVDSCVVDEGVPVYYLYREEPDMSEPDDKYPDSGWRIRGDYRDISDAELEGRESQYIALGAVLNADDDWLNLIDAPVGSAFIWDGETGAFVPCED